MPKSRANAVSKIHMVCGVNGLKSYGKVRHYPDVQPGDKVYVEELSRFGKEGELTHAMYPAKWGYTWCRRVSVKDFNFLVE